MIEVFTATCGAWPAFVELGEVEQEAIIRRLERSCFNSAVTTSRRDGIDCFWTVKKFRERYSTECYSVLIHLQGVLGEDKTPHLLRAIIDGRVNPNLVTDLDFIDKCPEATVAERIEIDRRRGVKLEIKTSKAHTCRCGKSETTVLEYAGRSADEGMCLSIKCIHCKRTWRK